MNSVSIVEWNGLKAVKVDGKFADAVVTLHGAHVVSYIPKGGKDLLWISKKCVFTDGKSLRGGVPVIWPWFGSAGKPSHGLARLTDWTLTGSMLCDCGSVRLDFSFTPVQPEWKFLSAKLSVTIGKKLKLELTSLNSGTKDYSLTQAFHTYFAVSDVSKVRVTGLEDAEYLDRVAGDTKRQSGAITFDSETDRCYISTADAVIDDPGFGRRIRIAKSNSGSTVVWNPWIEKARKMADFGDEEYPEMLCVETACAFDQAVTLKPGVPYTMTSVISAE